MNIQEFLHTGHQYVIYGAGDYGQRLKKLLDAAGVSVQAWLVSSAVAEGEFKLGLPVYSFSTCRKKVPCEAKIIVAVASKYADEIVDNITDSDGGFSYYVITPEDFQILQRLIAPCKPNRFLSTTSPVSRLFGCDRGMPIDRYYVNKFLKKYSEEMASVADTIEVGEALYSQKYFPGAKHDVLSYDDGMDLTKQETLKDEYYDVFICTQVYNFIYNLKAAIKGSYYMLKAGGTLLATVAGNISQVSQSDMDNYGHFWGFTYLGIRRAVEEVFGEGNVQVFPFGNVMAATAFIQGVSVEELPDIKLLDQEDPNYAICIGVVATKE